MGQAGHSEMTLSEEPGRGWASVQTFQTLHFYKLHSTQHPSIFSEPNEATSRSLCFQPAVASPCLRKGTAFSSPLLTSNKSACLSLPRVGSGLCQSEVLSLTSFLTFPKTTCPQLFLSFTHTSIFTLNDRYVFANLSPLLGSCSGNLAL